MPIKTQLQLSTKLVSCFTPFPQSISVRTPHMAFITSAINNNANNAPASFHLCHLHRMQCIPDRTFYVTLYQPHLQFSSVKCTAIVFPATFRLQLWHWFSNLKSVYMYVYRCGSKAITRAYNNTFNSIAIAPRSWVCLSVTWKFLRLESFSFWQRTSHVKARGGIKKFCMRNMTFLIKQSRARVCKWFLNVSCGCPWNFYAKYMNVLVVGNWWGNPLRILNLCCRNADAQQSTIYEYAASKKFRL